MKNSSSRESLPKRLAADFSALAAIFCAIALNLPVPTHAAQAARPNIVFIFSDDHAWQAIRAYNDRECFDTPNIDRLAEEGMRFDRCLVPNAICGPSRATVLTGQLSSSQRLL